MSLLSILVRNKILLFLCFWLMIAAIYLPAWKAGFMGEFINYLQSFDRSSFVGFLNRKDSEMKTLFQVVQLQRYGLISVFGVQPVPWFLLFTALHALNGALIVRFFTRVFDDFRLKQGAAVAVAGAVLFLLNPNITEITVWKACDHYLTGIMMQLLVLIWCRDYITTGNLRYARIAGILFAISTYTLEIFYVTPFLSFFLLLGYRLKTLINPVQFRKGLFYLLLPQLFLFLLHFIVFRITYGSWIPHYGTEEGSFMTTGSVLLRGYGKYLAYMLLMAGHYTWPMRQAVYEFLAHPAVYYLITGGLLLTVTIILLRFSRIGTRMQLFAFMAGGVICSLSLAVTVSFDDLVSLYNSRRCYQPGIFLYMAVSIGIFAIRNKKIALILYGICLAVCLALTVNMVWRWRTAAKLQYGALRTFDQQTSDPVLLLNVPCYFRDVRMIAASDNNEFKDQLRLFGYQPAQGTVYTISSYNMLNIWDGAHVTVLDSLTVKITLNQWGTWWMYNYRGAQSYENSLFRVDMTDPGHEYLLELKQRPESMVLLFHQGEHWRTVDMRPERYGHEQW